MIWFPLNQSLVRIQNIAQIQLIQLQGTPHLESQAKNYSQLLEYCKNIQKENQQLRMELECLRRKTSSKKTRRIKRRVQSELVKNFYCLYPNCKKQYASELALNLHMKLKHNAGSKRERISAANRIIKAEVEGLEKPDLSINLPPEYIKSFKQHCGSEGLNRGSQKLQNGPSKHLNDAQTLHKYT